MHPFEPEIAKVLARTCRWSDSLSTGNRRPTEEISTPAPVVRHVFAPDQSQLIHSDFAGISVVVRVDLPDTSFAALLEFPNFWALVFQGTVTDIHEFSQSVFDWLANFHAGGMPAPDVLAGNVHKGFLSQYQVLHGELKQILRGNNWGGKPLYVCGHSQGGALAQLLLGTSLRQVWNLPIQAVYTFASPRAGDRTFVASLTKSLFRFEFGDDPVPHLPPDERLLRGLGTNELVLAVLRSVLGQTRYVSPGILFYSDNDGVLARPFVGAEEQTLNAERAHRFLHLNPEHHSQKHYCRISGSPA